LRAAERCSWLLKSFCKLPRAVRMLPSGVCMLARAVRTLSSAVRALLN
jgi:hypothetical protein